MSLPIPQCVDLAPQLVPVLGLLIGCSHAWFLPSPWRCHPTNRAIRFNLSSWILIDRSARPCPAQPAA
uniref:Uncharacterized protein n=1 Tax=Arundo donax TaxID=35708 RepID=A0A0A9AZ97_ARUDO